MSWESVLKIIGYPTFKGTLFPVLMRASEFENTMKLIQGENPDNRQVQRVRGVLTKLGNDKSKMYEQAKPFGDATFEEFSQRFDKLKSAVSEKSRDSPYFTEKEAISELDTIRNLILQNNKEEAEQKFIQFKQKVPAFNKKRRYWAGKSKLTQKYLYVEQKLTEEDERNVITFEKLPKNVEILEKFAKILDGEVKNGKILFNLANSEQYAKKIEENSEFYKEEIMPLVPNVQIKDESPKKIDEKIRQGIEMLVFDKKYVLAGNFTKESVKKYIDAIGSKSIKGDITRFLPKTFPNGEPFPKQFLVSRQSGKTNSIVLNPYGEMLLDRTFNAQWFQGFFSEFRINQIISEREAEMIIISDIVDGLIKNLEESPKYGVELAPYLNDKTRRYINENNINMLRLTVRNLKQESAAVTTSLFNATRTYRNSRMNLLDKYFTKKEEEQIMEMIDNQKAYALAEDYPKYYNLEGQEVEEENAFYVEFVLEDEEDYFADEIDLTPQNINEYLGKSVGVEGFGSSILIPKTFTEFVNLVNGNGGKLEEIMSRQEVSAKSMEQIDPENFLAFIAKMVQRALGDDKVDEVFMSLSDNPQDEEAQNALNDLSNKLPEMLNKVQSEVVDAFEDKAKDLGENFDKYVGKTKNDIRKIKPLLTRLVEADILREES